MRVLILGATGGTGRELVRQACDLGLMVTAFGRQVGRLPSAGGSLRIVQGDVGDATAVADAMEGQDAVLSALGVGKPLAKDAVVVNGIRNTLASMKTHGVRRLVYLSFIGVRDSRASAGPVVRYIARFPLRNEIADHEAKEALIAAGDTDWTIVRAPTLTNGATTGRYRDGESIAARSLLPMLSRGDVAHFMLNQLTDDRYVRRMPRVLP
jgi:putative NADH-flavin reductase